ncbi:hypothetical protein LPB03_04560 [Polaribacter vadi]|uniref:Uncharacterized protein n=1 Tax=Polaribacter vadi TaxID=1774273 RepID=A0A1B8TXT7_9FLAO|nr:DUF6095 family protein [Polaribacter vadi]AOW16783.1 hypothetical protein LPB03_04560 [Polaribacter vadi]OBY64309.1 hypothetical protein LPB3_07935 [Polaribacter vadi]
MSTDKQLLSKALVRLGILILLFILCPVIMTMGFKALDKFTGTNNEYIAYLILGFSSILLLYTLYFGFKTFGVLQKAIFNEK